jgi:hypothetical protein
MARKANAVLMIGFSAAGAGALLATVWFGIPAALTGVVLGAASGFFALRRTDTKPHHQAKDAETSKNKVEELRPTPTRQSGRSHPGRRDDESDEREASLATLG